MQKISTKVRSFEDHIVIFFISFACILLELFLTRILNLKAWNHVVYVVIPFAILGYGIGTNLQILMTGFLSKFSKRNIISAALLLFSAATVFSVLSIIKLPIKILYLVNVFHSVKAIGMLLAAYTLLMIPFIVIGFLVVYLFSSNPRESHVLYFFDLLGAGLGATVFFVLINHLAVFRSLLFLAVLSLILAYIISNAKQVKVYVYVLLIITAFFGVKFLPEIKNYVIDERKGWEYIPGFYKATEYETVSQEWHPLGRTDIFRMKTEAVRNHMYRSSPGTFEINLHPRPEFAYLSTNFLAGTPAFNLSDQGLAKNKSQLKPFTQIMEAPYLLVENPSVLVIGVGGGRDIFMAKTHGAVSIIGAEINPGIVRSMSKGGELYEYTGGIYEGENTAIYALDGRYLVKKTEPNSIDLIVLNGVDTFSGLSSGAYSYAESYLYTKNAIMDYLRVLKDDGIVNFNRWLFDPPRETLRLEAIAMDALKTLGAEKPWEHILIGDCRGWSCTLIKKTPFKEKEIKKVVQYLHRFGGYLVYPSRKDKQITNTSYMYFDIYADLYKQGLQKIFAHEYPYDISVITDNDPFFYKYYKLASFNPFRSQAIHHTGTVVFLTQFMIMVQAIIFIAIFILLPLYITKKKEIKGLPSKAVLPFIVYFSCLGMGFMFIEISIMQRFVLLLGSPIHSISVVLAVLLVATGVGSYNIPKVKKLVKEENFITATILCLVLYLIGLVVLGTQIYDHFMRYAFAVRVILTALILFPLGFLLGIFFPSGLQLVGEKYEGTIPWAWGINCGFSVLGSILAISLAQFIGFNDVLLLAVILYFVGLLSFKRMQEYLAV